MRLLASWVVLGMVVTPAARAWDVDAASLFLDTAKKKFRARKYDEAILLLRKAADEDAHLLEIYWLEGQIREKQKEPSAALEAYRNFLEHYAEKARRGNLEDGEAKLKKKIDKRVDTLAAGERALAAWEDKYVSDLLALAEKHASAAPRTSKRALELILELRPKHERARELYIELGGTPLEDCTSDTLGRTPFDRWTYSSTTDMIEARSFGRLKSMTHKDGLLLVKTDESGSLVRPVDHVAVADEFVYHASFRMMHTMSGRWLTGLVFAMEGRSNSAKFLTAFVKQNQVILHRVDMTKGEREDVADLRIPEIRPGVWTDLLVHVKGHRIEVYVNGKKYVNYTAPRAYNPKGGLGLFQQSSDSEYRALRVGRMD